MRPGITTFLFFALFAQAGLICTAQDEEFAQKPKKVVKTNAEWAKKLTRNQFLVTRMKATEPAFSGKLLNNHSRGVYTCVCCDAPLFTSGTKFTSGTGWPSFWRPYGAKSVATQVDLSSGEQRVEVECATCNAHLGHVFDDGPAPTGLRFCINSLSLKFVKPKPAESSKNAKAKSDDESSKNAKAKSDADEATSPKTQEKTGSDSTADTEAKPKAETKPKAK